MTSNWNVNWLWGGSSSSSSSSSKGGSDNDSSSTAGTEGGTFLIGLKMGKRGQTRFKFIESKRLNTETVAGIKDMNLGRVVRGEKIGL